MSGSTVQIDKAQIEAFWIYFHKKFTWNTIRPMKITK